MQVVIAVPIAGDVPPQAAVSWLGLVSALRKGGYQVAFHTVVGVSLGPDWARNELLREVVTEHGPDTSILWLDADMQIIDPGAVVRMIDTARSRGLAVIGAAGLLKQAGRKYGVALVEPREEEIPGVYAADGIGGACVWWSADVTAVLWAEADEYGDRGARVVWRTEVEQHPDDCTVEVLGEDFAVCRKIQRAGWTVWCDSRVALGHVGTWTWAGRLADDLGECS